MAEGLLGSLGSLGGGWGTAIGGLFGGLLGGNSAPATTTSKAEIDPVVKANMYNQLAGTKALYDQQMAQGGLNDMQRAGLQQQANVYSDPSYNTGFQQMRSLGSGLLGQPIAGNPFTNGSMADGSWRKGIQSTVQPMTSTGVSYMPTNFDASNAFKQSTYTPPALPSPQQIDQAVYHGQSNQAVYHGQSNPSGSSHSAPDASAWDTMGDVEKAQYYADNPTMAQITKMLQLGFSLTDIAKVQNYLDPGFALKQQQIANGDAFGAGPSFGTVNFSNVFAGLPAGDISQIGVNLGNFGDDQNADAANLGITGLLGGGGYGGHSLGG